MEAQKNNLSIPMAIVAAGIIIFGGIFMKKGRSSGSTKSTVNDAPLVSISYKVPPVSENDHIIGNPDAKIVMVEYSDLECPACQFFHPILDQVIEQYGKGGDVAWVYRHFPLKQIHPKAVKEAEAAECAAELGGNQKFWAYVDRLFAITPANNGLDPLELPKIATYVGLDREKFVTCLESGKYTEMVEENLNNAAVLGVNGTPTTFFMLSKPLTKESISNLQASFAPYADGSGQPLVNVSADGKTIFIGAAFRFEGMKQIIDDVLKELN